MEPDRRLGSAPQRQIPPTEARNAVRASGVLWRQLPAGLARGGDIRTAPRDADARRPRTTRDDGQLAPDHGRIAKRARAVGGARPAGGGVLRVGGAEALGCTRSVWVEDAGRPARDLWTRGGTHRSSSMSFRKPLACERWKQAARLTSKVGRSRRGVGGKGRRHRFLQPTRTPSSPIGASARR